jgi:splicing factor 3B subunit 3
MLIFYEMDLGLNHVVRKFSSPVDNSAHLLIPVPGEPFGPGGILVICEGFIQYKKVDHDDRECAIPLRNEQKDGLGLFTIAYSTFIAKTTIFFLIQSEFGDLYRVNLDFEGA